MDMMDKYFISVIFINNSKILQLPKSIRLYNYLISNDLFDNITLGRLSSTDTYSTFQLYNIENTEGYKYGNSYVIFVRARPIKPGEDLSSYKELKSITYAKTVDFLTEDYKNLIYPAINEPGWYLNKIALDIGAYHMTSSSTTTSATTGASEPTFTFTGNEPWFTWTNDYTTTVPQTSATWTYTYPYATEIDELKNRLSKLENNNKKGDTKMFDNLTKNLKCGRAQDVRMSIYGPAFKGEDNSWYSVDTDGELTDVTDLLFDMDSYCYMMPVAKNAIVEGDFILHNGHWIKVVEYTDGAIMNAVDIFTKQYFVPAAVKSPFGFEFYTKLIPLVDFSKMTASADTPFGALPMVLMMNNKNDKDMLPMLMMMGMQNNFKFDMSNPLMMYLMMKDGDNSNLLPIVMLGQMQKINE